MAASARAVSAAGPHGSLTTSAASEPSGVKFASRLPQQWRRIRRCLLPCMIASFLFAVGAVVGLVILFSDCACAQSTLWNWVLWFVPPARILCSARSLWAFRAERGGACIMGSCEGVHASVSGAHKVSLRSDSHLKLSLPRFDPAGAQPRTQVHRLDRFPGMPPHA
jgi:hypothetical protein